MPTKTSKTSKVMFLKLKRQHEAIELRRSGLSFAEIGLKLGISKSRAHVLVQLGLESATKQNTAAAETLRALELSRLDGLLEKMYPLAKKGDVSAGTLVLKISERRAKLLGLEAPVRIEATGADGAPMEVSSSVRFDPSKLSMATLRELLDARSKPDGG